MVGAATAVILAAGAGATVATPAAAVPPGLVQVGSTSPLNSSSVKTWTTACPPGTVVTGGGGYLVAPAAAHLGLLGLDRLEPLNNGSGFTAAMREVFPDPLNWRLATDALCLPPPPGWAVVSNTGPLQTQVVSVSCGNKNLIGVGGRINNGNGNVILDHVVPMPDLKTVQVRGTPVAGRFPTGWSVTAIAVCANTVGQVRVAFASPPSSASSVSQNWSCPAGMGLYSVGADISPGSGAVFLDLVRASTIDNFALRASERPGGYPFNWVPTVWGVCGP
jgi:hypothetical protein